MPTYLLAPGHILHLSASSIDDDLDDLDDDDKPLPTNLLPEMRDAVPELRREARKLGLRIVPGRRAGTVRLVTVDGRVLLESEIAGILRRRLMQMQRGRLPEPAGLHAGQTPPSERG